MQYQLHTLCLRRLHLWFLTPPLCTPLHRPSLPPRHQLFQLHGILLQLHLTHRLHHLHLYRAHRTHLVPFILHHWQLQLQFLQPNSRHPAVKAAPRLRSEKKLDKPRRSTPKATPASLPATPPEPTTAPSPPISPELAALGSTTQQLAESVRLIQAQQQMILDSQRAQEQRQQLLHQNFPTTGPTLPSPSPTPTPPTPMLPPAPKARPIEPVGSESQHGFDSASCHPTSTNIAITPTTIQDSKITLPSTIYTFPSPTTFPSSCASFSSSSTSLLDQT